jgi:hypothetical protein
MELEDTVFSAANDLFSRKKYSDALSAYKELANSGSVSATLFVGWMYQEGLGTEKNLEEAINCYKLAAESGSVEGAFRLGTIFLARNNCRQAMEHINWAADQDYPPALYKLGRAYSRGYCVPQDDDKAMEYYNRAAQKGHLYARRELAVASLRGRNGLHNIPVGLFRLLTTTWQAFRLASSQNHSDRLIT